MKYTRLGDTGLVVSKLAFGAMTFGSGEGAFGSVYKVGQENAKALVDRAVEAGVNFFDTADGYADGQSEVMLGWALGKRRKDVVISTKVGFRRGDALTSAGLTRKHILASAEGSLKRLGTDYIDVYIVHRDDPLTPVEETLEALNDLVRAGLVRYVGFSNWPAWKAAKALGLQRQHGWAKFVTAQMYYSLLNRDLEHEVAPFVQDAGIGTMIWSPLAGGFLSGKYTRESLSDTENRLSGFDFIPFDKEKGFRVVDELREIAKGHGASVAQVALAWLLAQPHVGTVLVGSSKLHQLEDNLGAVHLELREDELRRLDELTAPTPVYPNWFAAQTPDALLERALTEGIKPKKEEAVLG